MCLQWLHHAHDASHGMMAHSMPACNEMLTVRHDILALNPHSFQGVTDGFSENITYSLFCHMQKAKSIRTREKIMLNNIQP